MKRVLFLLTFLSAAIFPSAASSYSVGSLHGEFSVGSLGGAQYVLPIEVPSGPCGIGPTVALAYSSQSGNGPAGMGFSISGTSVITRSGRDHHRDGFSQSLQFDTSDAIALDGTRLVLTGGTMWASGSTYSPENDPFTTVTLHADSSAGNVYFTVRTSDGTQLTYGSQTRLIHPQHTSAPICWYLDRREDLSGNFTDYSYQTENGTVRLTGISYGGNSRAQTSSACHVDFIYQSRPDTIRSWLSGMSSIQTKRLNSIRTAVGDSVFRIYTLTYSTPVVGTTYHSRLQSVTVSNSRGESLAPLTFSWNAMPSGTAAPSPNGASVVSRSTTPLLEVNSTSGYLSCDMNGDGLADLISINNVDSLKNGRRISTVHADVHHASVQSDGTIRFTYGSTFDLGSSFIYGQYREMHSNAAGADVTGDGQMELIIPHLSTSSNWTKCYLIIHFAQGGNILTVHDLPSEADMPCMSIADINRDGCSDILLLDKTASSGGNSYGCCIIWGSSDSDYIRSTEISLPLSLSPETVRLADFDGDGTIDLLACCTDGTSRIFWNRIPSPPNAAGISGTYPVMPSPYSSSASSSFSLGTADHIETADVDGDGLTDILTFEEETNTIRQFGNAGGTFQLQSTYTVPIEQSAYVSKPDDRHMLVISDYDHDGRDDILVAVPYYSQLFPNIYRHTDIIILRSTPSGFEVLSEQTVNDRNFAEKLVSGDFDGDGNLDLLCHGYTLTESARAEYSEQSRTLAVLDSLLFINEKWQQTAGYDKLTSYSQDSLSDTRSQYPDSLWSAAVDSLLKSLAASGSHDEASGMRADDDQPWYYFSPGRDAGAGRIASVTDSYGACTTAYYSFLTESGIYSRSSSTGTYPLCCVQPALSVVSQADIAVAGQGLHNVKYRYAKLKVHLTGLGLLGYDRTTVENTTLGQYTVSEVINRDPSHHIPLYVSMGQTIGSGTDAYRSTTDLSYAIHEQGNGTYCTLLTGEMTTDMDGVSSTTAYTYDNASVMRHASPLETTTSWSGNQFMTRSTSVTYTNVAGLWLPQNMTSTSRHPDDTRHFRETTRYGYHPQTAQTDTVISRYGTAAQVMRVMTHDLFGNITSETTAADTIPAVTQYTDYSTDGRYPVRTYSSPALYVHTYNYDIRGVLLSETDCSDSDNRLTTTYSHDGWGRLTGTTFPDGTTQTTVLANLTTGGTQTGYTVTASASGSAPVTRRYNCYGLLTREQTTGPSSKTVTYQYSHNRRGQVTQTVTYDGSLTLLTYNSYDNRGRLVESSTGSQYAPTHVERYSYGAYSDNGRRYTTVTETTDGLSTTRTCDEWGLLTVCSDAYSSSTYRYRSHGQPSTVTVSATGTSPVTTTFSYDSQGRRLVVSDPDGGTVTTTYDALDRTVTVTDARGSVTENRYDIYGRVATVIETPLSGPSSVTTYVYGTSGGALGQPSSVTMTDSDAQTSERKISYSYDRYGRVTTERHMIGSATLGSVMRFSYDTNGLCHQTKYGTFAIDRTFDNNGYLEDIKVSSGSSVQNMQVWHRQSDSGHISSAVLGNSAMTDSLLYSDEGQLSSIRYSRQSNGATLPLRTFQYEYQQRSSRLSSRSGMWPETEQFSYDQAGRLTSSGTTAHPQTVTYGPTGNILSRPETVGTYDYDDPSHPHAVTGISNPYGLIDSNIRQEISYTAFGKVSEILEMRTTSADGTPLPTPDTLSIRRIIYGPDHQRWQTQLTDSLGHATTYTYLPGCDEVSASGTTTDSYYIQADGRLIAVVAKTGLSPTLFFTETDHLGSLTGLVNTSGVEIYRASFDAWGNRTVTVPDAAQQPAPGTVTGSGSSKRYVPLRGFTGHEHYSECGLIDMNGRMYDPLTVRFLSPDPYVQMPYNPQNFNRYSYCLNNPLLYTDPDGEIIWDAVIFAAIMGGMINTAMNCNNLESCGDVFGYFAVGALAGAAGGIVGQALAGSIGIIGFLNGFVTAGSAGFSSGFINGSGNAWMGGSSFSECLYSGLKEGLISGTISGFVGGISGGIVAIMQDRSFWDGAIVTKDVIADHKLPIFGQNAKKNCVAACGESLTGGDWSQDYIRNRWNEYSGSLTNPDVDAIKDHWAFEKYADKLGCRLEYRDASNQMALKEIVENMQQGNRIGVTFSITGETESGLHTVLLNKVVQNMRIKPSGKNVSRYIFQVMDPAGGGSYHKFYRRTLLSNKTSFLIIK
ncbi:MAG: FG-GAP-like repeat-containing protein [Bacteroidaceae bacterium]|nr:FG-GAP-like repeat-containing protein [Bacteroidaceae bacterium]